MIKEVRPKAAASVEGGGDQVVVQSQDNTFTSHLPEYLQNGGDDSDETTDWEVGFVDWQGNNDPSNSNWVLSNFESEPEVVEDSVSDAPDLNFDDFEFEHRYALEHWEELSNTLQPNHFPFMGPNLGLVCHSSRCLVPLHKF